MTTYSGAQRRTGLALWGAVGCLGVAAGVLLGGALTTWAGWQTIFWINVPIGVVALVVAIKVVPAARPPGPRSSSSTWAAPSPPSAAWPSSRPRRHRDLRLGLGPDPRPLAVSASADSVRRDRASRRAPAGPAAHVEDAPLVSGTTVMLGVTGILVGTVFLTSIFVQTVRTVWRKIDVRKTAPTRMPETPSMTVVPDTRVRILHVCTGISGRSARRSITANAASRAAEIASVARVRADAQP